MSLPSLETTRSWIDLHFAITIVVFSRIVEIHQIIVIQGVEVKRYRSTPVRKKYPFSHPALGEAYLLLRLCCVLRVKVVF